MSWYRTAALLLVSGGALADTGEYIIGGGIEADNADAIAIAAFGEIGIGSETWLYGAVARNTAELPRRQNLETWYGDIGLDHFFDPVGIRAAVAYWGDSDTFDSVDWRSALYWRSDRVTLTAEYEFRDFELTFPSFGPMPARRAEFDANGWGARARFDVSEAFTLSLGGIDYEYSRDISISDNPGLVDLINFSRLSLINSLVDYRANVTFGLNDDVRNWELDLATWRGEVDGGRTNSYTLRFLTPMGKASDIELGLGLDDSELYGEVVFFSVFVYFYGS